MKRKQIIIEWLTANTMAVSEMFEDDNIKSCFEYFKFASLNACKHPENFKNIVSSIKFEDLDLNH